MPHKIKIVCVLLIGTSLCVFALAAGLLWYANSGHAREKLLREVNARVPGRLAVGHHHISLFKGRLFLRNLRLSGPDGRDLAGLEELSIDFSMASIFRKSLVVEALECVQPWTRLSVDSGGRLNIAKALASGDNKAPEAPSSSGGLPFNVIVNRFRLSDGYVEYAHAAGRQYLTLKGIEAGARFNLQDKSGVFQVSAEKIRAGYNDYLSDFKNVTLALAVNNGHIEPLVLKAENQFASLLLYGDIRQVFSDPQMDLTLDLEVALAETETFLGLDRKDTGRVKAFINIKGRPDDPQLNLSADYGGGRIEGRSIDHAGLRFRLADRTAFIDKLSADTGFGSLDLSGQVDLRDVFPQGFSSPPTDWSQTHFTGRLKTTAVNLASIVPAEGNINGSMDAVVEFNGKGVSIETLAADASATIGIDNFQSGGMAHPLGIRSRMNGRIQDGTLWLDALEVAAADANMAVGGSLDLGSEQIDAHFSFETPEVAPLLSVFGLPRIKGAIAVNGNVKGRSTNPAITMSSKGSDVGLQGIDVGDVILEAGLNEAGRLSVDTLTIQNQGSSLNANGEIQLFAAPFQLHPDMPLSAWIDFANVEYRDFMPDRDIRGSLRGKLVLSGNVRSLKANADVVAEGIEVEQIRLGDLAGKAKFSNGALLLDSLRLTNNRTDLKARGEIRLLQKDSWQTLKNPTFKLDLADGHIFLEDFNKNMAGALIVDSNLEGRLNAPQGSLSLRGENLDLGVQRIEALVVNLRARDQQVTIESFDMVMPGGGTLKGGGAHGS